MAEPFSIIQGAISLATTGIAIASALKTYIGTVRKAEKILRPVIRDIEVISGVLTQIGTALENGEIRSFCTPQFYITTNGALESCKENFHALEAFTKGLAPIDGSEIKITTKLGLYFKQQDLNTLRGNMSESKASLNLVIGTLQIIIAMRTAPKDSAAVEDLKLEMYRRIREIEKEKTKETSQKPLPLDPRLRGSPSTAFGNGVLPLASSFATMPHHNTKTGHYVEGARSAKPNQSFDGPDSLLDCLQDASRVSFELRLEALDLIDIRKLGRYYDSRNLHSKYDEAQGIFSTLWAQEKSSPRMQQPTSPFEISNVDVTATNPIGEHRPGFDQAAITDASNCECTNPAALPLVTSFDRSTASTQERIRKRQRSRSRSRSLEQADSRIKRPVSSPSGQDPSETEPVSIERQLSRDGIPERASRPQKSFTTLPRIGAQSVTLDTCATYPQLAFSGWQWDASSPYSPSGYGGGGDDWSDKPSKMVLDEFEYEEPSKNAAPSVQLVSTVDELLRSWTTLDV